jgi:hypothetical protein
MKMNNRWFVLACFLLLTFAAHAQTSVYKPFPTDAEWIYMYYDDWGDPTYQLKRYVLTGDTMISNVAYKMMFYEQDYRGAIRESNKVVYFVPDTSMHEYRLYDFNKTLEDTIIHPFGELYCSDDTMSVTGIDSLLCSDGYHRVLKVGAWAEWIEGIGSKNYLLDPVQYLCLSGNDRLQCVVATEFSWQHGPTCIPNAVAPPAVDAVAIVPNPSSGPFRVSMGGGSFQEVRIVDAMGTVVMRGAVEASGVIRIDDLPCGTYILVAMDGQGNRIRKKIVHY